MAKAIIYKAGFLEKKTNMAVAKYISKNAKTDIFNLKDLSRLNLDAYDTIIFGTANKGGKADDLVQQFVEGNKDTLSKKKLKLYVLCGTESDKCADQVKSISDALGIPDPVCFYMKKEDVNEAGLPADIDKYIATL